MKCRVDILNLQKARGWKRLQKLLEITTIQHYHDIVLLVLYWELPPQETSGKLGEQLSSLTHYSHLAQTRHSRSLSPASGWCFEKISQPTDNCQESHDLIILKPQLHPYEHLCHSDDKPTGLGIFSDSALLSFNQWQNSRGLWTTEVSAEQNKDWWCCALLLDGLVWKAVSRAGRTCRTAHLSRDSCTRCLRRYSYTLLWRTVSHSVYVMVSFREAYGNHWAPCISHKMINKDPKVHMHILPC